MLSKNDFAQDAEFFACSRNSQFSIKLHNGYCVDIGFAPLHFCNNYHSEQAPESYRTYGSNNGELAIIDSNHRLITGTIVDEMGFDWCAPESDILEDATPTQFTLILRYLLTRPAEEQEEDD